LLKNNTEQAFKRFLSIAGGELYVLAFSPARHLLLLMLKNSANSSQNSLSINLTRKTTDSKRVTINESTCS